MLQHCIWERERVWRTKPLCRSKVSVWSWGIIRRKFKQVNSMTNKCNPDRNVNQDQKNKKNQIKTYICTQEHVRRRHQRLAPPAPSVQCRLHHTQDPIFSPPSCTHTKTHVLNTKKEHEKIDFLLRFHNTKIGSRMTRKFSSF